MSRCRTTREGYRFECLARPGILALVAGIRLWHGREEIAPGVVKRVYEAVYAKLLVSDDEVHRPDPRNMTPKTKALFDLLFPE
jgi:hypothetical protein